MRWVTAYQKTLLIQERRESAEMPAISRSDGLTRLAEAVTPRSVHELLFDPRDGGVPPLFPALLMARTSLPTEGRNRPQTEHSGQGLSRGDDTVRMQTGNRSVGTRTIAWLDPLGTFYPPAAAAAGIPLAQLCLLRPSPADLTWTAIECLRCRGMAAVIALAQQRLTRVEVRKLQLAAEHRNAVGVLLRPRLPDGNAGIYAAATRWLVSPARGERTIQRWKIQQIHGQGRHVGQSFLLEKNRASGQTNLVPLPPALGHHPAVSAAS